MGANRTRIERAIERAIDQAIEQAIEGAIARAIERPSDRAIERSSDRATERPSDRATERSRDRTLKNTYLRKVHNSSSRASSDTMPEPSDVENGWVTFFKRIGASHGPNVVQTVTLNKKNDLPIFVAACKALQKLSTVYFTNLNNRKSNLRQKYQIFLIEYRTVEKIPSQEVSWNVEHPKKKSKIPKSGRRTQNTRTVSLFQGVHDFER